MNVLSERYKKKIVATNEKSKSRMSNGSKANFLISFLVQVIVKHYSLGSPKFRIAVYKKYRSDLRKGLAQTADKRFVKRFVIAIECIEKCGSKVNISYFCLIETYPASSRWSSCIVAWH